MTSCPLDIFTGSAWGAPLQAHAPIADPDDTTILADPEWVARVKALREKAVEDVVSAYNDFMWCTDTAKSDLDWCLYRAAGRLALAIEDPESALSTVKDGDIE